jgi:hypothetical protein
LVVHRPAFIGRPSESTYKEIKKHDDWNNVTVHFRNYLALSNEYLSINGLGVAGTSFDLLIRILLHDGSWDCLLYKLWEAVALVVLRRTREKVSGGLITESYRDDLGDTSTVKYASFLPMFYSALCGSFGTHCQEGRCQSRTSAKWVDSGLLQKIRELRPSNGGSRPSFWVRTESWEIKTSLRALW